MTLAILTNPNTELIASLCKLPKETEWVEFKHNNGDPDTIGENISALANAAALHQKNYAYVVWGIDDKSHEVIGSSVTLAKLKKGQEEIESWLLRSLTPNINIEFHEEIINDLSVLLLKIQKTFLYPVKFKEHAYIRVGSYTKKLKDHPEKERKLWHLFQNNHFEKQSSAENLSDQNVFEMLNYPSYFDLIQLPLPNNPKRILEVLEADQLVFRCENNSWGISNLGAILFAKDLNAFKSLKRKTIRVIFYHGKDRISTSKEKEFSTGYASCFKDILNFINDMLPSNEIIKSAYRENILMFPALAIRELVANALIHQDFSIGGAGPMIEIFSNRMEITNPGKSLIESDRLLDNPPKSRNEDLACFMRRLNICEERGSGIDKIVFQTEYYQLPAPLFETVGTNTRAVLFAHKPMKEMDKQDRIRACYLHACLKYVSRETMTNTSLRERFKIEAKNSAIASRIIKETTEAGLIRLRDPEASRKFATYLPFWAI